MSDPSNDPAYSKPPTNTISAALKKVESAINERDSIAYWSALTWENREWADAEAIARTIWDSTKASHVSIQLLSSSTFTKHVHSESEHALFAHARIRLDITGANARHFDQLTSILRVDTGMWKVGELSLFEEDKPFVVKPVAR